MFSKSISPIKILNSAIGLVFLILLTTSNVYAEKSLREKFRTGDTSSSSSEQSLKEQFQTQDLTITPEYRVLSQKEAWESITPAKDLLKTWKLLTADSSDLFQCGLRPGMISNAKQPSNWLAKNTHNQCDASGTGGVCFTFGVRSNNNDFRYIFDRKSNQISILGQYDVKRGDLLMGDLWHKRGQYLAFTRLGSMIAYSENRGLTNPFPTLRALGDLKCELYPIENNLYCLSKGNVSQIQCLRVSKIPLMETLQEYAATFNKVRAIAECQSYNTGNSKFQFDCERTTWKKFVVGN